LWAGLALLAAAPAAGALPVALSAVPVPEPKNLARFVKDKPAAIRLGKALFWDIQLGSDGRTGCATCHFHAGTDNRTRNTVAPGPGAIFEVSRPNGDLRAGDFPFHDFEDRDDRRTAVVRSRNDVVGAQGVPRTRFQSSHAGRADERGATVRDALYVKDGRNVRQVTGRNSPSVINAVFNIANFWDGRAHPFFNGVNPFGLLDAQARVLLDTGAALSEISLTADPASNPYALDSASLASQAVGPVPNDVEMSWAGRGWRDIGRKLYTLLPLARQRVHPTDGVLGPLSRVGEPGLATTYPDMIRAAFQDEFWRSAQLTDGFTQMEANTSLFFGLAVQLYQATLVSDDTPFDRFVRGNPAALTERQIRGMNLFFSGGTSCSFCHVGPELTAAAVSGLLAAGEPGMIEVMATARGDLANYDIGFYNIGVRPTGEDLGRGGRVTLNGLDMPLSFTGQHFERAALPFTPLAQPGCANNPLADPPTVCPAPQDQVTRQAVNGAFKTPGLRNVELTGPYMHNGSMATLMQVVDFYVRGGNFHEANAADLDPIIDGIAGMQGDEERKGDLVEFLRALTDERVRWEKAPFDHPQLFVPDGHEARIDGDPRRTRVLADRMVEIPAVGAAGRQAQSLPPLKPFLADGLEGTALHDFHFGH
jgi:cytochrome c peroxidase